MKEQEYLKVQRCYVVFNRLYTVNKHVKDGSSSCSKLFKMFVKRLRGVEWVHDLFLFPLVLGKMKLPHAKLGLFCVV